MMGPIRSFVSSTALLALLACAGEQSRDVARANGGSGPGVSATGGVGSGGGSAPVGGNGGAGRGGASGLAGSGAAGSVAGTSGQGGAPVADAGVRNDAAIDARAGATGTDGPQVAWDSGPNPYSGMIPAPEAPMALGNTMIFDDSKGMVWNPVAGELLFSVSQLSHIRRWRPGVANAMNFDIVRPGGLDLIGFRGLALAPDGALIVCEAINHRVTRSSPGYDKPVTLADGWPGGAGTPASKFNTPQFVVARKDRNIYFTDPQVGPASATLTGLYRIDPEGKLSLAASDLSHPEGITLSADHNFLFVSTGNSYLGRAPGIFKFAINPDGSLGARSLFVPGNIASFGGGLCMDQAGNLYQALGNVRIYGPDGTRLAPTITAPGANSCAFGDADLKSLFITAGGSPAVYNLWRVRMNIPGAL